MFISVRWLSHEVIPLILFNWVIRVGRFVANVSFSSLFDPLDMVLLATLPKWLSKFAKNSPTEGT